MIDRAQIAASVVGSLRLEGGGRGDQWHVAIRVSDDPYVYPGTDVLRNLPGIRDGDELVAILAC